MVENSVVRFSFYEINKSLRIEAILERYIEEILLS